MQQVKALCTEDFTLSELRIVLNAQWLPPLRATADALAKVVATLEQAAGRREAGYLVLLDVQGAFDGLPHSTVVSALHELGIPDRLLDYVRAFLSDGTLWVRVGVGYQVRASVHTAIDAVDQYMGSIGLQLSVTKTEALLVHPRGARARSEVPPLTLRHCPLPWRKSVHYLGLQIDCRVNFNAAVSHICKQSRKVASAARFLLACGHGCMPQFALRVCDSVAKSRALYALPTTNARAPNWNAVDMVNRTAVRELYGLPRSSQVGATLAEVGNWPPSLRAQKQALHHIEHLQRSPQGQRLICRLHSLPNSGMGKRATEFSKLIGSSPQFVSLPYYSSLLDVNIAVPGVASKRRTAVCAMRQETTSLLHERLAGRLLIYTDGSVTPDGSGAAACTAPDISETRQCRLRFAASSTVAEIAAIYLAADLLLEHPNIVSAAIFIDSREALCMLARDYARVPLVLRVGCKLQHIVNQGCDLVLQWIPAHIGLQGNKEADSLAKAAHGERFPLTHLVMSFDAAKTAVLCSLTAQHPDRRVTMGMPPRLLPRAGLSRADCAFLLRLRIGCYKTAAHTRRLTGTGSPVCGSCDGMETLEHLLRHCPAFGTEREALYASYHRCGLPSTTLQCLLFPNAPSSITNCTSLMQPLDQEIISSVKCAYHKRAIERLLLNIELQRETDMNVFMALEMLSRSWQSTNREIVDNCENKA
ncbi:uncharacterized protein [Dermacentor albipictus]|uniref:uncharacterized protein n=1 Tax=Dermacentor albipictus TaxID=60249 RepID=UPI0038FC3552